MTSMPRRTPKPGSWVEVRNRFNRRWAAGFVVESVDESGYEVRRVRDNHLIPQRVPAEDVRPTPRMAAR
jgi:hypothetical protein